MGRFRRMGKLNARIPRLTNIMSQKAVACLVFVIGLTCLLFAHASGSEDYDDRLAAAEQIFWQDKIPQMYFWKLRHLQNPESENLINEDAEVAPQRKRGGKKFNGLRRYGYSPIHE